MHVAAPRRFQNIAIAWLEHALDAFPADAFARPRQRAGRESVTAALSIKLRRAGAMGCLEFVYNFIGFYLQLSAVILA